MTAEQVVAASNGNARLVPDNEVKKFWNSDRYISALAKASHIVDGERFTVTFLFSKNSKRLQRIDLSATNLENCFSYRFSIFDKYGPPIYKNLEETLMILPFLCRIM